MNWKLKLVNISSKLLVLIVGILSLILGIVCTWYGLTTLNTEPEVSWRKLSSSFLFPSLLVYGLLLLTTGSLSALSVYGSNERCFKLFLFFVIMSLCVQLGTWSTLQMQSVSGEDFVDQAWSEMNQKSRNNLQRYFNCCGLTGLSEFAQKLDPVDESCYRNGVIVRSGCKKPLINWILSKKHDFYLLFMWTSFFQFLSVLATLIWIKNIAPRKENINSKNKQSTLNDEVLLTEPSL